MATGRSSTLGPLHHRVGALRGLVTGVTGRSASLPAMAPGHSHMKLEPGEELARHGLRATRQRIAVVAGLREHRGHPTALAIHQQLVGEHPNLSQKTVYETLDALVD